MKNDFSTITLKELACLVYEILKENGIDAVLVGGACVSIYSENRYQSYDLDFVTHEGLKSIEKPLLSLGFKRKGRYFFHEECPFLIDFINPPIAIGREPIRNFNTLKTTSGSLLLLTPTDCVKDRLAAYIHWNDMQALEQALLVAKAHKIDLDNILEWAKQEGALEKIKNLF